MKQHFLLMAVLLTMITMAQQHEQLPYSKIPDPAESYTAGTVASRMVDGLGFRYYWATEGLRPEDLNYRPSASGRTTDETLDHILGLTTFIINALSPPEAETDKKELSFEAKRRQTLLLLKTASDILKKTDNLEQLDNANFPFWNLINGPIADALWHCGQVVMLRRASGNPFNSKVSVFWGKLRE